jgi:hypothetical protein
MAIQTLKPHPKKGETKMENLTYTKTDEGWLRPDLALPKEPETQLGRLARMRLRFLKEEKMPMFSRLLTEMRLTEHLAETEKTAWERIELTTERTAKAMGVDERMKAEDPMKWAGLMGNIRATAEQEAVRELILA